MGFSADYDANIAISADVEPAVAADSGLVLFGYSAHEVAAVPAVATVHIVDGATVAGGTEVAAIRLAASNSKTIWFGDRGIATPNGLSIEVVAGEVDVTLFYKVF